MFDPAPSTGGSFLADLAESGAALSSASEPVASRYAHRRGVRVHGIDLSLAMARSWGESQGADEIGVTIATRDHQGGRTFNSRTSWFQERS